METPVRRYSSALQLKCVNSRPSLPRSLICSRIFIPAAMTSGPMPSPGTTAIRWVMRRRIIVGGPTMKRLLLPVLLFSASSLFALDLSLTVSTSSSVIPAGMHYNNVVFTVHNPGPGVAKDVKVTFASSVPIPDANLGDVPPNVHAAFSIDFVAPATAGPLTITATETSSTPDENTANNTASLTLTVVTGPDVEMLLHAPVRQDLALPFTLDVFVGNFRSVSDAHNVVVTIDFRDDVRIAALPAGCTSPRAGRIVCSAGTVAAGTTELTPRFSIGLVAPEFYGSSAIVFTAVATEDEQDFDPNSNTQTAITTLRS